MQGVYKIQNTINGKLYIGSSVNIERRFKSHKKELNEKTHNNIYLQNAWNKYGEDSFVFEVIEIVNDRETLREREQYYIEIYNSANHAHGYNILSNTNVGLGVSASDEIRAKISRQCTGSKNGHYGKKHSDTTKEQIRQIKLEQGKIKRELKEKKWLAEKHQCEVCGIVMIKKYGSGRFCSKNCVNQFISNQNKQIVHTKEWNDKMRNSLMGRTFSEEHKRKISMLAKERLKDPTCNSMYGKHHSEETKRKISNSLKNRRAK